MTMKITVETYEKEAEVQRTDPVTERPLLPVEIVPPHSQRVFYAHKLQAITFREKQND